MADCREMQKGDGVLFVCSRYTGSAVNSARAGTPVTAACLHIPPAIREISAFEIPQAFACTYNAAWCMGL